MPPKRNPAGAGVDDANDADGGEGERGLTFDQQMALLKLKQEHEERLKAMEGENLRLQRDIADLNTRAAQATHEAQLHQQQQPQRFDIFKASGILPVYDESEVELYLANFETLAEASKWPRDKWALVIQPKLTGKALKAVSRLTVNDVADYDKVRQAILDELELVPEVYKRKFRSSEKRMNESYADFAHFLTIQCDRWIKSEEVDCYDKLRQLVLREQFLSKVPQDVKVYLLDKDAKTVVDLARTADEFAAVHKNQSKQTGHISNRPNGSANYSRVNAKADSGANYNDKNGTRPRWLGQHNGQGYQGQQTRPMTNSNVECFNCRGPHFRKDCPRLKQEQASTVSFVTDFCNNQSRVDLNEYVVPVTVRNSAGSDIVLPCWRDTGALVSCLREGSVPQSCLSPTGETVSVIGVTSSDVIEVPQYKVTVDSDMVKGEIKVALTPRTFGMPSSSLPFLLGNDFGPKLSFGSAANVSAVLTRRQVKLQSDAVAKLESNVTEVGADAISIPVVQGQGEVKDKDVDNGVELTDAIESVRNLFEVTPSESEAGQASLDGLSCAKLSELQKQDVTLKDVFAKVSEQQGKYGGYYVHANGLLVHSVAMSEQEADSDRAHGSVRVVVPRGLREKVLQLAHAVPVSGHLGVGKTRQRVAPFFYWPGMLRDIRVYCQTCDVCQRNGKSKQLARVPMRLPPIIDKPFGRISIDIVGPLPITSRGNRFVLTVVDHSTRWVEAYAMPEHKSTDVVKALLDYLARYGIVDEILHDLGTDFTSELMQVVLKFYGVCQIQSSVAHPQTNTAVERFHGTLKSMIRALSHEHGIEWDDALPLLLFAYREVPVAEYGFSPYELVFGRYVRGPLSIVYDNWWESSEGQSSPHVVEYMLNLRDKLDIALETVHKRQAEAQADAKVWYDKKARCKEFKEGDLVLVYMPQPGKPLAMKYVGPYKVLKQTTPVDYLIEFPEGRKPRRVIHANLLKRYYVRSDQAGDVTLGLPLCSVSVAETAEQGAEDEPCLLHTPLPTDYGKVLREKTSHLAPTQAKQIIDLIDEYRCVVSDTPGLTNLYTHHISIKQGAKPVRLKPYRMAPKH